MTEQELVVMNESINQALAKGLTSVGSKLEAQFAELNERANKTLAPDAAKTPDVVKSAEEVAAGAEKAKLEQPLAGITKMEVWDIPVGQALIGGFIAVFSSELIDGFLSAQSGMIRGVVKLVGAGVAARWGSGLLGSTGSKAVALLLAYDGIRSFIPIDEWASRLAGGIKPLTGAGLGGRAGMERAAVNPGGNGHAEDYYAKALGR